MLPINTYITIGDWEFDFVQHFTNDSTFKNLTDTATISLPRALKTRDGLKLSEAIKSGNEVRVEMGYGIERDLRFSGYVARIGADTAIAQIECEDEMWKLKQSTLSKSWADTDVRTVIEYVKSQTGATWKYEIMGDSVGIGAFKFEKLSAAGVLKKLKDDCYQTVFFRDGKLIVGKPYEPDPNKLVRVRFEYGKNVISWKDLVYKRKDELRLKVTAISHNPDGKKTEVVVGDALGEERTLNFYNLSKTALKHQAEAMLESMKYDGYRGSFPTFGFPTVKHGYYVAELRNWLYPEKNGDFLIDAVNTEATANTLHQVIGLGAKV